MRPIHEGLLLLTRPSNISVIIPAFNAEQTIGRAIASICRQTVRPREIVVIDDGSEDDTSEIVRRTHSPMPLRLIRQQNAGVSAARNSGVQAAESANVAFLDADDRWLRGHIAELDSLIRRRPAAAFWCTSAASGSKTARLSARSFPRYACGMLRMRTYSSYLKLRSDPSMLIWTPNISTVAAPRELMIEVGGFPEGIRIGEDLALQMRLADHGRVFCSNRVTVLRILEPKGVTNSDLVARNRLPAKQRIAAKFENGVDMAEARLRQCPGTERDSIYIRRYIENRLVLQLPRIVLRGEQIAGLRFASERFSDSNSLRIRMFKAGLKASIILQSKKFGL